MVGAVTQNKTPDEVLLVIAAVSFALLTSLMAEKYLNAQLQKFMFVYDFKSQMVILKKSADSDYENMECADGLTRVNKAMENVGMDSRGARLITKTLSGFFTLKMTASWNYRNKDNWNIYDRKLNYLRDNSGDFTRAKDLRLYGMTDWFRNVFENTLSDRMKWHKKEQLYGFGSDGLRAVLSLLREGIGGHRK